MEFITNYGFELVVMAGFVGFIMAWGIGANDVRKQSHLSKLF
jgi:PiT family inorganic phosphate transporter